MGWNGRQRPATRHRPWPRRQTASWGGARIRRGVHTSLSEKDKPGEKRGGRRKDSLHGGGYPKASSLKKDSEPPVIGEIQI